MSGSHEGRAQASGLCPDENESMYKKTKMRTATDVISRLQWDESLPKGLFIVGYLDRFKGLMEKPFITLDWNDPAVVDNYTLAIPKHRIQYFKYKNKKVWEKSTRTDLIFGSTGQSMSIHDLMTKIDEEELCFYCEDEHDASGDEFDIAVNNPEEPITYNNPDRSNFFVASRITDEETLKKLSEVSDNIKEIDPSLSACCIKDTEYHLTLVTLRLETTEDISNAVNALEDLKTQRLCFPIITLENLSVFRHRVLYACIAPDKELDDLRSKVIDVFKKHDLEVKDKFTFVPHVTIMKLSRPIVRAMHTKYIDPSLYLAFQDNNFGSQIIHKLSLCEMGDIRGEDGFYSCATEVDLL